MVGADNDVKKNEAEAAERQTRSGEPPATRAWDWIKEWKGREHRRTLCQPGSGPGCVMIRDDEGGSEGEQWWFGKQSTHPLLARCGPWLTMREMRLVWGGSRGECARPSPADAGT